MDQIRFHQDHIDFLGPTFACASVVESPRLQPSQIKSVRLSRWPPEIELKSGEILFIAAPLQPELRVFSRTHQIPIVWGPDLWSYLTEPFLDTEVSVEWLERIDKKLIENGFLPPEIAEIRTRVGPRLQSYNAIQWEWIHLGHFDVLKAHEKMGAQAFADFYDWSMRIASRSSSDMKSEDELLETDQASLKSLATSRLSDSIGYDKPQAFREQISRPLVEAYAEPHRRFHDLRRVIEVAETVNSLSVRAQIKEDEKRALTLAAWFHAYAFAPDRRDNQEKSVEALSSLVQEPPEVVDQAASLIRMTRNPLAAQSELEILLGEATLAILGSDPQTYLKASRDLRQDFQNLSDREFAKARLAFLERVRDYQKSDRLFTYLHPIFEERARDNIGSEIARLTGH